MNKKMLMSSMLIVSSMYGALSPRIMSSAMMVTRIAPVVRAVIPVLAKRYKNDGEVSFWRKLLSKKDEKSVGKPTNVITEERNKAHGFSDERAALNFEVTGEFTWSMSSALESMNVYMKNPDMWNELNFDGLIHNFKNLGHDQVTIASRLKEHPLKHEEGVLEGFQYVLEKHPAIFNKLNEVIEEMYKKHLEPLDDATVRSLYKDFMGSALHSYNLHGAYVNKKVTYSQACEIEKKVDHYYQCFSKLLPRLKDRYPDIGQRQLKTKQEVQLVEKKIAHNSVSNKKYF